MKVRLAEAQERLDELTSYLPHCSRCGVVLHCDGSDKEHTPEVKIRLAAVIALHVPGTVWVHGLLRESNVCEECCGSLPCATLRAAEGKP